MIATNKTTVALSTRAARVTTRCVKASNYTTSRRHARDSRQLPLGLHQKRASFKCEVAYLDEVTTDMSPSKQELLEQLEAPPAGFSGMKGKALVLEKEDYPTMSKVLGAIPKHCFELDTWKSMKYAGMSTGITLGLGLLAHAFIPLKLAFLPVWIAYALANGTAAFGFWLMGHEAGHGAFSNNKTLQDVVGFISHSLCLTPYFSWQRSHAVHHSNVNHINTGESHVPKITGSTPYTKAMRRMKNVAPEWVHGVWATFVVSIGWLFYLTLGASGGPEYGLTNHFWPYGKFETKLFPKAWHNRMFLSGAGVLGTAGLLAAWAFAAGSIWPVVAVYGGPYLVMISWLGIVTLLHHTDTDVPHLDDTEWNHVRGAFLTIDRPYYPIVDFLQHHIGSTHVLHHLNPKIPHYHAQEATEAIKEAFPDLYLYDPTPVHAALYRIACNCISVKKEGGKYIYDDPHVE